jgi:putative membrane protein
MMGFGFIGMLLGGLLLAGLLALLVVGLVMAARGATRGPSQETQASREEYAKAKVMALLAERYARGEIDDEEYRKKKCELR